MQAPNYGWLEWVNFIHTSYHQLQGLGCLSQYGDGDVFLGRDDLWWRMYGFGLGYAEAFSECFGDGAPPAVSGVYEGRAFVFPYFDWEEVIKSSLLVVNV